MSRTRLPAKALGIGWDVGGWHGRKNAVAVLGWDGRDAQDLASGCGALPPPGSDLPSFLDALCSAGTGDTIRRAIEERVPVVVAVDAPLGLPAGFREFLANPATPPFSALPGRFLDNSLAFRDTDREIASIFGNKAPLSATFDKLGNPTTVAMHFVACWTGQDGPLRLHTDDAGRRWPAVIEVYPALCKVEPRREADACEPFRRHIDAELEPGSDLYDATVCAVLALGFAVDDRPKRLPRMTVARGRADEGAIWYPRDDPWRLPANSRARGGP